MDYKKVLGLHFVNHLSCREITGSCSDCSKTTVNEFLKRFRENPELSHHLSANVTNEYIGNQLYKKTGASAGQLLHWDFNKKAVYKALPHKWETLKHLWQKYNSIGIVDGILRYAEKYSPETPERCCKDAVLAGRCNYSYICNTISAYPKEPAQSTVPQSKAKEDTAVAVSGTYKDDDSKYSLKNLLKRPETGNEK